MKGTCTWTIQPTWNQFRHPRRVYIVECMSAECCSYGCSYLYISTDLWAGCGTAWLGGVSTELLSQWNHFGSWCQCHSRTPFLRSSHSPHCTPSSNLLLYQATTCRAFLIIVFITSVAQARFVKARRTTARTGLTCFADYVSIRIFLHAACVMYVTHDRGLSGVIAYPCFLSV